MGGQPSLSRNHLLASLPPAELAALAPFLATRDLPRRASLAVAGRPLEQVTFPLSAVAALVGSDAAGTRVEIAAVGFEGMVGVSFVLGVDVPSCDAEVGVPGFVAAMPATAFRSCLESSPALRSVVERYIGAHLAQIGQGVVCNRLHELEGRAARWLLATRDRVAEDQFALTHDVLAAMLGVSRPKVTLACASLQRAGLIDNPRGRFRVRDRTGLERASCGCYEIIRADFARILGVWARPDLELRAS